MNSIEVCNYLEGKNLCNFFANLIVEEIKKTDPTTRTEITVINTRNFFVVRGITSSTTVLNLTDILTDGYKRINQKWNGILSVIDTINYNHSFDETPLLVSLSFKGDESTDDKKFVDFHAKEGLLFNIKKDPHNFVIMFDCNENDTPTVKTLLEEKYPQYNNYKSDFSNDIYISERYYGLSMDNEKPYHILLKNISKHIFRMGFSNSVGLSVFSNQKLEDTDNLNVIFKIKMRKSIVKKEWLKSLLLDLFPFSEKEIIDQYNLSVYNCENEIIPSDEVELPFESMNKISEFLLV